MCFGCGSYDLDFDCVFSYIIWVSVNFVSCSKVSARLCIQKPRRSSILELNESGLVSQLVSRRNIGLHSAWVKKRTGSAEQPVLVLKVSSRFF